MTLELLFTLDIDIDPQAKQRPRMNMRTGMVYTPKETRNAERVLRDLFKVEGPKTPTTHDVELTLDFRVGPSRARPDIDNFAKLVMDAGNGVLWHDDRQVVWLLVELERDSREPGTSITVRVRR